MSLVNDVPRLFQAFVGPAIFVSASALLLLSLNSRLMGMVTRIRQYVRKTYDAARRGNVVEAELYGAQLASIERRAELIRRAFLLTVLCLAGTIASCLLLGVGLYWPFAEVLAAVVFIASILSLLGAAVFYAREVAVALSSVRDEVADLHVPEFHEAMLASHYVEREGRPV